MRRWSEAEVAALRRIVPPVKPTARLAVLVRPSKPQTPPRGKDTVKRKAGSGTYPRQASILIHLGDFIGAKAEYRFAPPRRWRFDFALPQHKIAVEQEGGLWVTGRHNRPVGFMNDMEKYNEAVQQGWKVLRFTPKQIKDGTAHAAVHRLLNSILSKTP